VRTTLTLDGDVAARLERVVRRRRQPFEAVVNVPLAGSPDALDAPPRGDPFRATVIYFDSSSVGTLDDIEEVLSRVEGDDHT
jgi:hypothetical protein